MRNGKFGDGSAVKIVHSWHAQIENGTFGKIIEHVFDGYAVEVEVPVGKKRTQRRVVFFNDKELAPA